MKEENTGDEILKIFFLNSMTLFMKMRKNGVKSRVKFDKSILPEGTRSERWSKRGRRGERLRLRRRRRSHPDRRWRHQQRWRRPRRLPREDRHPVLRQRDAVLMIQLLGEKWMRNIKVRKRNRKDTWLDWHTCGGKCAPIWNEVSYSRLLILLTFAWPIWSWTWVYWEMESATLEFIKCQ